MKKWIKNFVIFCFIIFIAIVLSCCKQEEYFLAEPPVPMKTITQTCGEDTITCDIPEDWKVLSCTETGITIMPSEISGNDYTLQDTISISRYDFNEEENEAIVLLLKGQSESFQTYLEQLMKVAGNGYSVSNFSFSFDKLESRTLAKVQFDMVVPKKEFVVYPYIEYYFDDIPYAVIGIQNDSFPISTEVLISWIAQSINLT